MPDTDMVNTSVIGLQTGHSRTTKNWILGRLLRDEDDRVDQEMEHEQNHTPPKNDAEIHNPPPPNYTDSQLAAQSAASREWEALRLTIYEVDATPPTPHGVPNPGLGVVLGSYHHHHPARYFHHPLDFVP
jgi:hypothetical protein